MLQQHQAFHNDILVSHEKSSSNSQKITLYFEQQLEALEKKHSAQSQINEQKYVDLEKNVVSMNERNKKEGELVQENLQAL